MNAAPVALVLAGGRGRRYAAAGGAAFKQREPFAQAQSLVEYVCELYAGCGLPVVCALHPDLKPVAGRLARAGYGVVIPPGADSGMGSSLAAAVAAAPSEAGWLVALADMPWVHPATVERVAAALAGGAALCAPFHAGRRGHPVGFASRFGAALRTLSGDSGAASILKDHPELLIRLRVDDPGVLLDIDVPADRTAFPCDPVRRRRTRG